MKQLSIYFVPLLFLSVTTICAQQSIFMKDLSGADKFYHNILSDKLRDYEVRQLDIRQLQMGLQNKAAPVKINLHVSKGTKLAIEVEPYDIRAEEYVLMATTATGQAIHQTSSNQIYKGHLTDNVNSDVRILLSEETFKGYILQGEEQLFIEPLSKFEPLTRNKNAYVIFNKRDWQGEEQLCNVKDPDFLSDLPQGPTERDMEVNGRSGGGCLVLEVATETDYEAFQHYGSIENSAREMLWLMNQVEAYYQLNFSLSFRVTFQHVWSVSSDPYSPIGDNYNQFYSYWKDHFSQFRYDAAYLGNGSIGGGQAVPGSICSKRRYARGGIWESPNDLVIAVHEFGHLLGSEHTEVYYPGDAIGDTCRWENPMRPVMCAVYKADTPIRFSPATSQVIRDLIRSKRSCFQLYHPDNVTLKQELLNNEWQRHLAKKKITAFNDFVVIGNSGLILQAGEKIVFQEGFQAKSASNVSARVSSKYKDITCTELEELGMPEQENDQSLLPRNSTDKSADAVISALQVKAVPNPFRGHTVIQFNLERSGPVHLNLYDLSGKPVKRLINGSLLEYGQQEYQLNAAQLPAGIYLVKLITQEQEETIRLVVL